MNKRNALKIGVVIIAGLIIGFTGGHIYDTMHTGNEQSQSFDTPAPQIVNGIILNYNTLSPTAAWENDDSKMSYTSAAAGIEFVGVPKVVSNSRNESLLLVDCIYSNFRTDARTFINDSAVYMTAFQDGIELQTPTFVNENGVYDTFNSYTLIKSANIDAQRAFVLRNLSSPVEIEITDSSKTVLTKHITFQ